MPDTTDELQQLRHQLHRHAEKSGKEHTTAGLIRDFLTAYEPDQIISDIGGAGLAAVYEAKQSGPTVLIRAELDALPISDTINSHYASANPGVGHKCGHDGHMTIVAGLAPHLHERRPDSGRVVLLFQPAEEIGQGAGWVIDDPQFAAIRPDYVFALHNLPGFAKGTVIVRDGVFASASTGLIVRLTGATSHAAEPHRGRSPALAVAQLITGLSGIPQFYTSLQDAAKVTVIHARLGEVAFGTSPGYAEVMATLRSYRQDVMDALSRRCLDLIEGITGTYYLDSSVEWVEPFPSTVNNEACVQLIRETATDLDLPVEEPSVPFPWSEDFGNFTALTAGALFGLGAGEQTPALHHPTYDFPDELIPRGIALFAGLIRRLIGGPEVTISEETRKAT